MKKKQTVYTVIPMGLFLAAFLFMNSCTNPTSSDSGSDDTGVTSPFVDLKTIQFATPSSSISSNGSFQALELAGQTEVDDRIAYVNDINSNILVTIPNGIIGQIVTVALTGENFDQPKFFDFTIDNPNTAYTYLKLTIQQVSVSGGYAFRGYISQRGLNADLTIRPGGTFYDQPIELYFTSDFTVARFSLGIDLPRHALEYNYNTKSGFITTNYYKDDDPGTGVELLKYEEVENGSNYVYAYYEKPEATEILRKTDAGVEYLKQEYDDSTGDPLSDTGYGLLVNGTVVELSDHTEIDAIYSTLTNNTVIETNIDAIYDRATLTGSLFDTLLPIHQANVVWTPEQGG